MGEFNTLNAIFNPPPNADGIAIWHRPSVLPSDLWSYLRHGWMGFIKKFNIASFSKIALGTLNLSILHILV